MDHTEDDIQRVLVEKAKERWDTEQRPYFLSDVGMDMGIKGIDYRAILGEERIKGFVQRTQQAAGYRLVQHPLQKAKIGIVPADAEYSFTDAVPAEPHDERRPTVRASQERAVLEFLRALSNLSEKDQDGVVIPVRVLTKLLGIR